MFRNPVVIAVAVVALLGVSAGSAFAAGRVTGDRSGAARARQETITELQGQFQQALARLQTAASPRGASQQGSSSSSTGTGETGAPQAQAGSGAGGAALRGLAGLGLTGQVEKIEGNNVTITLPQGISLTALLGEGTAYRRTVSGSKSDIKQGSQVTVEGQRQDDGTIQASQITLVSGGS